MASVATPDCWWSNRRRAFLLVFYLLTSTPSIEYELQSVRVISRWVSLQEKQSPENAEP